MMTWNWPACVKLPFTTFMASMPLTSAFAGSPSTKRMRVMQCETAAMFSLPPTSCKSSLASSVYFPMMAVLL